MLNLVLTVGTSILANLEHRRSGPAADDLVMKLAEITYLLHADRDSERLQTLEDLTSLADWEEIEQRIERHLKIQNILESWRPFWNTASPLGAFEDIMEDLDTLEPAAGWAEAASAERSSLKAIGRPNEGWRLHFISSDTEEGVLSAILNARIAAKEVRFERVGPETVLTDKYLLEGIGRAATATVHVVDGLRIARRDDFTTSLDALGRAFVRSMARHVPNRVLVSGGYKAISPFMFACCELTSLPDEARLEAYVVHENSEEAVLVSPPYDFGDRLPGVVELRPLERLRRGVERELPPNA